MPVWGVATWAAYRHESTVTEGQSESRGSDGPMRSHWPAFHSASETRSSRPQTNRNGVEAFWAMARAKVRERQHLTAFAARHNGHPLHGELGWLADARGTV